MREMKKGWTPTLGHKAQIGFRENLTKPAVVKSKLSGRWLVVCFCQVGVATRLVARYDTHQEAVTRADRHFRHSHPPVWGKPWMTCDRGSYEGSVFNYIKHLRIVHKVRKSRLKPYWGGVTQGTWVAVDQIHHEFVPWDEEVR